ncbi:polysaccharide deacetylase family protein [Halobacillus sp. Nhm2S1]|uniref:polysaccharide deacetylase family protein n=1 Tax=Halobacillus sp. Nhm2S1 TaxID=2866716 RepID=UPI001C73C4A5|nr:polysaccharide deacetylase family protein [Halobacillus sp. Nhm2S1]MBX0356398.1 polysaccharide deacetylase family protein [Halobacillus sp. Nhm2S1]
MSFRLIVLFSVNLCFFIGFGMAFLSADHVVTVNKEDTIYQKIQVEKAEYEWEAQDAKIDSVWKKTPGIVGRKVDVEASYKKMQKHGKYNPELYVYKLIKPEVSLEDLPASPIYRGHPDKEAVSFLINVSWGEEYIPDMVEILNEHQVKATFFIDGAFANDFTHLVQMIEEEGHTIGSHGYRHKDMGRMTKEQAKANLEQADELLFALTKEKVKYFAPPSGSFNMATVEAADEMDMETILWTVDTIDWKKPTSDVLITRVMGKVHNGATILMHPTEVTVESLPNLIEQIKDQGYKLSSLQKLLSEER